MLRRAKGVHSVSMGVQPAPQTRVLPSPACPPRVRIGRPVLLESACPACLVAVDANAGDAVLMDSATWHCGGANTSDAQRCVLTASFGARGAYPLGSTYSILPHLAGWITLRMLREHGTGSSSGSAASTGSAALLALQPRRSAAAGDPTHRPKGALEAFDAAKAAAASTPGAPGCPDSPKARLADLLAWAGIDDGDDAPLLDPQLMGRVDALLTLDDEAFSDDADDDEDLHLARALATWTATHSR